MRSATLISERTREAPWAPVDRAAAHAAHRVTALVVDLDDGGLSLDPRGGAGGQGPFWGGA